jgi:hypothetical protein
MTLAALSCSRSARRARRAEAAAARCDATDLLAARATADATD